MQKSQSYMKKVDKMVPYNLRISQAWMINEEQHLLCAMLVIMF